MSVPRMPGFIKEQDKQEHDNRNLRQKANVNWKHMIEVRRIKCTSENSILRKNEM